MTIRKEKKAVLILSDGTKFSGKSFGFHNSASGEVVFNTGMVGYPETLSDPSYKGQILTFTYPLIGNYGIPSSVSDEHGIKKFFESDSIHASGLIVSDYSHEYSHASAVKSLSEWLIEHKVPAILGVDTRALTKKLREKGVMLGKIIIGKDIPIKNPNKENQVAKVSTDSVIEYFPHRFSNEVAPLSATASRGTTSRVAHEQKSIVLVDCGVKNNIIRSFLNRGVSIRRVPWDYDFTKEDYDGLFISNGPGDPKKCKKTIKNIKKALKKNKPIFGICLGSQLIALAAGADTYKLKYGHRSHNQPCIDASTGKCYITSQNHGYAVDEDTLPNSWETWFGNANDGTNEGIRHKKKPFFAVQFHPEAMPGPTDTEFLFDKFIKEL